MTVRVICDSSQNVPEAYLARLGIVEVQASLVFGDEVYLNKVDMSEAEFYQRLMDLPKGAPLPTTAQPSPGQVHPGPAARPRPKAPPARSSPR
jgi:fatty acid-binding protein DegV